MVASFFRKTGHLVTVALEYRKTVNSELYATICLPIVYGEIRKTNMNCRIILYQNSTLQNSGLG